MATIIQVGNGYEISMSRRDTQRWAERPGNVWVNGTFGGRKLRIEVGDEGLRAVECDGRNLHMPVQPAYAMELAALVSSELPEGFRHLWPCWEPELSEPVLSAVVEGLLSDAKGGVR